jgi:hypothetical protein
MLPSGAPRVRAASAPSGVALFGRQITRESLSQRRWFSIDNRRRRRERCTEQRVGSARGLARSMKIRLVVVALC